MPTESMKKQPLSIAVASGKGGTGKTFVSTMLFSVLSRQSNQQVELVDCDVEEPNDILFFPGMENITTAEIFKSVPVIDPDACTYCRKCVEYCEFNAIVVLPSARFAEVNKDLCHSCGACTVACADNAITETDEPIGRVNAFKIANNARVTEGRLKVGSSMQTMLIRKLKKHLAAGISYRIFDAPPGTSCPVVETIADADFIVLVAEPTPFGLHDLKLMINVLKETGKQYGVIINKAGTGNRQIYEYLEEEKIALLAEIPFSREVAEAYARGELLTAQDDHPASQQMHHIAESVLNKIGEIHKKILS